MNILKLMVKVKMPKDIFFIVKLWPVIFCWVIPIVKQFQHESVHHHSPDVADELVL